MSKTQRLHSKKSATNFNTSIKIACVKKKSKSIFKINRFEIKNCFF